MSDPALNDEHLRLMEEATRYRDQARNRAGEAALSNWDCGFGHAWDASLDVARNVRCMNCAAQRRELETKRLREMAHVRGGALLSPGYVDASTPLSWQCAHDHVWNARPGDVSRLWCAECARTVLAGFR
jgi:hypothetical protein